MFPRFHKCLTSNPIQDEPQDKCIVEEGNDVHVSTTVPEIGVKKNTRKRKNTSQKKVAKRKKEGS